LCTCMQVCKKRTKAFSKENNGTTSSRHGNMKLYKHVEVIPLTSIVRVININETDGTFCSSDTNYSGATGAAKIVSNLLLFFRTHSSDCRNIFALMVRKNHDTKEGEDYVFSFTITDNTVVDKCKYLRSLCNQIANIACTTDTVSVEWISGGVIRRSTPATLIFTLIFVS